YLLAATGHGASMTPVADEAINYLVNLLSTFVVDLTGAYGPGQTPARLFKDNLVPPSTPQFSQLQGSLSALNDALSQAIPQAVGTLQTALSDLANAVNVPAPTPAGVIAATTALQAAIIAASSSSPAPTATLMAQTWGAISIAGTVANALAALSLASPLAA